MAALTWDQVGQKTYETGVDHGVLYEPDETGVYDSGVAWNGLTTVTESPSGGETTKTYADNIVYGTLTSAEEFGATVEAYTYPVEFEKYDGGAGPVDGVVIGQQRRGAFGLSYRTLLGNDLEGTDYGYKIHLVYGAQAAPSEKANATVNDSPEMATLSWELTTTPVTVPGTNPVTGKAYKPTAHLTIDSTRVDADDLAAFEAILYGSPGNDPRLPLPEEVFSLFAAGALTHVDLGTPANQATYNAGTHVVTLPAVTGVQWKINGVNKAPGAQPALTVGQTAEVEATPQTGYVLEGDQEWTFDY